MGRRENEKGRERERRKDGKDRGRGGGNAGLYERNKESEPNTYINDESKENVFSRAYTDKSTTKDSHQRKIPPPPTYETPFSL